jgi:hypothetical protein
MRRSVFAGVHIHSCEPSIVVGSRAHADCGRSNQSQNSRTRPVVVADRLTQSAE